MLQAMHPEALNSEEEWAGVSSQQLRRKLQNRLNQRGHRKDPTSFQVTFQF